MDRLPIAREAIAPDGALGEMRHWESAPLVLAGLTVVILAALLAAGAK